MHVGRTDGRDTARPFLMMELSGPHGATSANGRIAGGYVHGLFHRGEARATLLASLGGSSTGTNHAIAIEAALDEIAAALERAFDITALSEIAGVPSQPRSRL